MPKKKKKKIRNSSMGAHGPSQVGGAGNISKVPESFTGQGINPRVMKAGMKVRQLVGKGYTLGKNANTSQTYKKAVKDASSGAGKALRKLGLFR